MKKVENIQIQSRLISPGDSNSSYKHCFAITYFQGKQLIAYGSGNSVVVTSNTFSIIDQLKGHKEDSTVTAVAWATYSGRLSSFASNQKDYNKIIIWEPRKNSSGWELLQEFEFNIDVNCLSWSKGDNILCAASKQNFQIFTREEKKNDDNNSEDQGKNKFYLKSVYTENIPTEFCSHSRDSRFILTLPMRSETAKLKEIKKNSDLNDNSDISIKGVLIYYKRGKSDNDYTYILIKHPAPVISARWRTSDQTHGNCCFMTVCEDNVVRIWYETGVNEFFKFSVVASTPSNLKILAASFISTSSKNISNNQLFDNSLKDENESKKEDKKENDQNDPFTYLSEKYKDAYAYGNGHLPKRDGNIRETYVNDATDLSGSYFYFLTFDNEQNLVIWQVTGLTPSVRGTPKISQLVITATKLGIQPNAVNNIYAFCRLTSEYSHCDNSKYIPQPTSLSLILQNKLIGLLTSLDLSINSSKLLMANFVSIHGHKSKIRSIRINKDYPFMVTLGDKYTKVDEKNYHNHPFIWNFNDTDVYDPSVLANFTYQLDTELEAVDWLYSKSKLIGFTGKEFLILPLPLCKAPIAESRSLKIEFQFKNLHKLSFSVLQFRVLCGLEDVDECNYIIGILFQHDFYLLHLHNDKMIELLHLQETTEEFTDLCDSYISQLFHEAGAVLCLISTKHKVYSILLNKDLISTNSTGDKQSVKLKTSPASAVPQSKSLVQLVEPKLQPGAPKKNEPASCVTIKEIKDTNIRSICFIHPAYYIIACDYVIYVCRRYHCSSQEVRIFQEIKVDYIPRQIRSNPHGMISVVSDNKLELYHQVRSSNQFNQSNMKWEKFACHEQKVSCAEWSLDGFLIFASNENIYALTKYMDTFFKDESRMFATIHNSLASYSKGIQDFNPAILIPLSISGRRDLVLNMLDYLDQNYSNPRVCGFYQNYVLNFNDESSKVFDKDVDALLDSLDNKARMNDLKLFNERETDEFINFISRLKKLLAIQPEILDQRSIPVARAIALDEDHSIPFDLINLAYISHDQVKLLDFVNFSNWDSILNSGVFFWMKDLKILIDKLVPFSISNFDNRKDVSIIILAMTQKFVVLKQLFKKCGEEAKASFFGRDFSKPKEKKSAEKNGYSALSKHDFYTAAAMFCLSGNINVAIRILMQNTGDLALAYLMCRYTKDDNKSLFMLIDDYLMPRAEEANDYAAKEFFSKQKNPDYQYQLDERIRSENCGNLISSSNHFYDMRFVSCEVLQTTVEQKADLCLSYLLSGASFLNAIYLNYLGKFVFHKEDKPSTLTESKSTTFDLNKFSLITTDESENETTDEPTENETSENEICVKEVEAFSFGGISGSNYTFVSDDFSSDYDDESDSESNEVKEKKKEEKAAEEQSNDDDNSSIKLRPDVNQPAGQTRKFSIFNRQSKQITLVREDNEETNSALASPKQKVPLVHFTQLSSSGSNESFPKFNTTVTTSTSNDSLHSNDGENEPKESMPSFGGGGSSGGSASRMTKPAFQVRNPAGRPQTVVRRMSQYFSSNKSTLMNPEASNLLNKYDNHLFNEIKNQPNRGSLLKQPPLVSGVYTKAHSDDLDDSSSDETEVGNNSQTVNLSSNLATRKLQSYSNWLLDVIVFNISRLRLEQFMNAQFNTNENLTSLIRKKISESSGNIMSMMNHFNDYLIRSCKRRGIISRRLLLINPSDKQKFIQDICHCMILLPDQIVASRLKKQQIAQITRTTQALVEIVNKNLIEGLGENKLFLLVSAAILTSIYIIALYKHDVKMMHKLLMVDLSKPDLISFVESVKSFLDYGKNPLIKDFLKVEFIPPGLYPKEIKEIHWEQNYISFLSDEMKKTFINSNAPNLPQYASSLIDFLIADTLIKKIKELKLNPLLRRSKDHFIGNFNVLLMNFKKVYDNVSQLFTYSTINFPSFIEFDSLNTICHSYNDDLNSFTEYLIGLDHRQESITKYTTFIINKFSLNSKNSTNSNLKKTTNSPMPLSRIGSQNESNISTLNFSEINDNIYASHKVVCLTKIVKKFVLEGPEKLKSNSSSVYSICLNNNNNNCSVLYYATDNGVKKVVLKSKSLIGTLLNQKGESQSSSEGLFLQFNKETSELRDHQEKIENENEGNDDDDDDDDNEKEAENKSNKTIERLSDDGDDANDSNDTIDSIQRSSSVEFLQDQNSAEVSTSTSNSSSSKAKRSKSLKQPPPLKIKAAVYEETPCLVAMSPNENAILVGYKNGRIDLVYLKNTEIRKQRSRDMSSESSEFSLSSGRRSGDEKSESKEVSESTEISESTEELKKDKSSTKDSSKKSKDGDKKSKSSDKKKKDSEKKSKDSEKKSKDSEKKDSKSKKRRSSDKPKRSSSESSSIKSEESSEMSSKLDSPTSPASSSSPPSTKSKKSVVNDFDVLTTLTLNAPNNTPCTALAFSHDGKIIAAAHKNIVRLWSLNMNDQISIQTPFSVIDTFSTEVTEIVFVQGTGLLITSQIESPRFKGNLCFWDVLLPGRSALVASLELKEQFGTVLSLAYSQSFSKVFAGTSRGFICVVDTKMFCVISAISAFSKKSYGGVQSIAIDKQQMFLAAGSTSGILSVVDSQNYQIIQEKEMVHSKKVIKSRGKLRDFSISSILIDGRMIYTCGYDGSIKSLYLNLLSS